MSVIIVGIVAIIVGGALILLMGKPIHPENELTINNDLEEDKTKMR